MVVGGGDRPAPSLLLFVFADQARNLTQHLLPPLLLLLLASSHQVLLLTAAAIIIIAYQLTSSDLVNFVFQELEVLL